MNLSLTWRRWILGCVFLALIGIQAIESTHHHETEAMQNACAVCQFIANQPLHSPPVEVGPMAVVLLFLFMLPHGQEFFRIVDTRYTSYSSRAPPFLTT